MLGNTMAGGGMGYGCGDPMMSAPMMACDPLGSSMMSMGGMGAGTGLLGGAGMGGTGMGAGAGGAGTMGKLRRVIDAGQLRQPNMCKGIAGAAAFFWFVVWVISIISTSIPDWWWWLDSTSGVHEGLWSTCWAHYCIPSNGYSNGCMSLLRVVRAFSVMTIIFSFFNFVMSMMLICCITRVLYPALLCGFLSV